MNHNQLNGRVALITGASKGIGKAIALALAGAGARLALASRDVAQLNDTADAARQLGTEAEVFHTDVRDEGQVRQLETGVLKRFNGVHILVNNAGVHLRKHLVDITLEEWRRVIETNVTGAFLMCRAFVPHMKGHGYGRILNLTSIMSHVAIAGRTAYCASKTALLGLTRALALELAADGITVNGISPGVIGTEMNLPILENPELKQQFIGRIPVGRMGKVEEIGALAVYLCSEEAAFITGADLLIDGGWCAQ
jgi:NAD(P)-dependent dehydrogenase (short-subunit alcohol dehydrogenase family)